MVDEYYQCPRCDERFETQDDVDDHIKESHTFVCPFCALIFTDSYLRNRHVEYIHALETATLDTDGDSVNHPSHYTAYKGIEIIDLTEQMNFCRGNAVKYIARAGLKDPNKEIEDLEKARWYINREIERLEANAGTSKQGASQRDW